MARRKRKPEYKVDDYRHEDKTRKHIPEAGIAGQGQVREMQKTRYSYDPHLPPALRFDETAEADRIPELLQTAQQRKLTPGRSGTAGGSPA